MNKTRLLLTTESFAGTRRKLNRLARPWIDPAESGPRVAHPFLGTQPNVLNTIQVPAPPRCMRRGQGSTRESARRRSLTPAATVLLHGYIGTFQTAMGTAAARP